ncbi:MAG TPA: hypothetical protein VIF62_22980 [Labilithrix sp.]
MRLLRSSLLSICLAAGVAGSALVPTDAHASVSIAVGFDDLVKDADGVALATPTDAKAVWEGGRIVTYTKLKVDQGVAGETTTGQELWVRTLGGVVGKIGQLVDGEPVFSPNKQSLLFLRKFSQGTYEVSARAQGQFPILVDDASKARRVGKNANVGVLFPPKPRTLDTKEAKMESTQIRLASEALHDRGVDDATKEIADAWKKAHAAPAK